MEHGPIAVNTRPHGNEIGGIEGRDVSLMNTGLARARRVGQMRIGDGNGKRVSRIGSLDLGPG